MAQLPRCILSLGLCTWLAAAARASAATTLVNGILGESVTFPLMIKSPSEVENIAWSSPEMSVAFVQPNAKDEAPRVSVTHERYRGRINISRGSYDLTISHLRTEDSRLYTANINTQHGTETRRFSLHVFSRLGTATITRSVTPTRNGTCNVTLTCQVEGGENLTFSWSPPGAGPTLYLSQGPEGHEGTITCTARNPVSSSNASVDAELLCTDALWGSELNRSWVFATVSLLFVLPLAVTLLFLLLKARRQLPPPDISSEKTVYAQVTVVPPADARVYEAVPSSKVQPGRASGMSNYATVV